MQHFVTWDDFLLHEMRCFPYQNLRLLVAPDRDPGRNLLPATELLVFLGVIHSSRLCISGNFTSACSVVGSPCAKIMSLVIPDWFPNVCYHRTMARIKAPRINDHAGNYGWPTLPVPTEPPVSFNSRPH